MEDGLCRLAAVALTQRALAKVKARYVALPLSCAAIRLRCA